MTIRSGRWFGGLSDDKLWSTLARKLAKTLTQSFGLTFYSEDGNLPGLKDALAKATAAGGEKIVDQSFMFGVQAARMLVRALENAGTDEPLKVNAAFRALKFEPGAMEIVLPIIPGRMGFATAR
jgi:hypothetical protein